MYTFTPAEGITFILHYFTLHYMYFMNCKDTIKYLNWMSLTLLLSVTCGAGGGMHELTNYAQTATGSK